MSTTRPTLSVIVDAPELLADALSTVGAAEPVICDLVEAPFVEASNTLGVSLRVGSTSPSLAFLAALGESNRKKAGFGVVCAIDASDALVDVAPTLSVPLFKRIGPALAAARFVRATGGVETSINTRALGAADRTRLPKSHDKGPRIVRMDDALLGVVVDGAPTRLGRVDDLVDALAILARTSLAPLPSYPKVEGADRETSLDVLVGPARTLSDPASKAALEPYDLPLPDEELCSTPSRAVAESQRIGFPVRVSLASPELRPSAHPEFVVEGVESSARVREAFRELTALAERTNPDARILGVTVGANTVSRGSIRVSIERADRELLLATLGFADPHGLASNDMATLALPAAPQSVRAAIHRLRGASLLADEDAERSDETIKKVTDVVLRCAAFMNSFEAEVDRVALDTIAVLAGGEIEIREASVRVTDAFTRQLDAR